MTEKSNQLHPPVHQRRDERVESHLPVRVGGDLGVSKNISASGIYFELDQKQLQESIIDFVIELDTPGGVLNLICKGEVVRMQTVDGKLGVGVKIFEQRFETVAEKNFS